MRRLVIVLTLALVAPLAAATPARAAGLVTVTVTQDGVARAGVFVALTGDPARRGAVTDDTGAATFSGVPDGSYTLTASAPGTTVGTGSVTVAGDDPNASVTVADSGNRFDGLGAYGAQTVGIAADGAPGVFYLTTTAIPSFYRTVDHGGTWSPVTISSDDPTYGIDGRQMASGLTTSGMPGEVAALAGNAVWFSRDFGTTWTSIPAPPLGGPNGQLLWGHAGAVSTLLVVNGSTTEMWYAAMPQADGDPDPTGFQALGVSFKEAAGDRLAIANGAAAPVLAVAAAGGADIDLFEIDDDPAGTDATTTLVGAAPSGAPTFVRIGGPATGPTIGSGASPSTVLVYSNAGTGSAVMTTYGDPGSTGADWVSTSATVFHDQGDDDVNADPGAGFNNGPSACGGQDGSVGSISPLGLAGTVSMCWVTQEAADWSELHVRPVSGINNNTGLAFSGGYDGATDAVMISGDGGKGAAKSASEDPTLNRPSFPQWPTLAEPGTDPASGGVSIEGIDAAVVKDTAFGPAGSNQIAVMFSFSGGGRKIASLDGGETWTTMEARGGSSIDWWVGDDADEAWIMSGSSSDQDMLAAVAISQGAASGDEATLDDALTGGHLDGTQADAWGVAGDPGQTSATAIAGVAGTDVAFVGTGNGTDGALRRVEMNDATTPPTADVVGSATELTEVDRHVAALAYCAADAAAGVADTLFVAMASSQDGSVPGGIAVVTDATGATPVVSLALNASSTELTGDVNEVRADCSTGTVYAGRSASPGSNGLMVSSDGGAHFTTVAVDPPVAESAPPPDFSDVETLEVDESSGDLVAVTDDGGVAVSADDGETWFFANDTSSEDGRGFGGERPGDVEIPDEPDAGGPAYPSRRVRAASPVSSDGALLGSGGGVFSAAVRDSTRPSAPTMGSLPTFPTSRTVTVSWSASTDADTGVVAYVVDRKRRAIGAGSYTTTTGYRRQASRNFSFTGASAQENCFRARAINGVGLASTSSSWRCTFIPADDRDLAGGSDWARRSVSGAYLGTVTQTSARGKELRISVRDATVIKLIATRCATCGTVEVFLGSTLLKRISLQKASTDVRSFLTVTSSGSRTGTLKIRVVSRDKKVAIDGVAVKQV